MPPRAVATATVDQHGRRPVRAHGRSDHRRAERGWCERARAGPRARRPRCPPGHCWKLSTVVRAGRRAPGGGEPCGLCPVRRLAGRLVFGDSPVGAWLGSPVWCAAGVPGSGRGAWFRSPGDPRPASAGRLPVRFRRPVPCLVPRCRPVRRPARRSVQHLDPVTPATGLDPVAPCPPGAGWPCSRLRSRPLPPMRPAATADDHRAYPEPHLAPVAQRQRQRTQNPSSVGSNPTGGTSLEQGRRCVDQQKLCQLLIMATAALPGCSRVAAAIYGQCPDSASALANPVGLLDATACAVLAARNHGGAATRRHRDTPSPRTRLCERSSTTTARHTPLAGPFSQVNRGVQIHTRLWKNHSRSPNGHRSRRSLKPQRTSAS